MHEMAMMIRTQFGEGDAIRDAGLTTPDDIERFDDIAYGPDHDWQMLDVYRPKGAELPLGLFYMNDLDTFYRKATLDENNDLFIRDSLVNGSGESLIRWQMCTEADPSIQPDGSIVLESGTHSRVLTITALPGYGEQSPLDAVPYSEDALSGNDYDAPNPGKHIVGFSFRLPPGGRINVLVTLRKIR
jgi:hypothetical protein